MEDREPSFLFCFGRSLAHTYTPYIYLVLWHIVKRRRENGLCRVQWLFGVVAAV